MMPKFFVLLTSTVLLAAATSVFAEPQCGQASGNVVMNKTSVDCLQVMGNARLTNATIKNKLKIVGSLNVNESTLGEVHAVGHVSVNKSSITGPVTIVGGLEVTQSTFEDNIKIATNTIKIASSTLQNIEIKASQKDKIPTLYLSDNTVVKGNIVFVNSSGVVVSHESKILGKVVNGKQIN